MNGDKPENEGSSDESIGRPEQWREGRYEKPGDSIETTVLKKPGEGDSPPDTTSTPVTQKDYEQH